MGLLSLVTQEARTLIYRKELKIIITYLGNNTNKASSVSQISIMEMHSPPCVEGRLPIQVLNTARIERGGPAEDPVHFIALFNK